VYSGCGPSSKVSATSLRLGLPREKVTRSRGQIDAGNAGRDTGQRQLDRRAYSGAQRPARLGRRRQHQAALHRRRRQHRLPSCGRARPAPPPSAHPASFLYPSFPAGCFSSGLRGSVGSSGSGRFSCSQASLPSGRAASSARTASRHAAALRRQLSWFHPVSGLSRIRLCSGRSLGAGFVPLVRGRRSCYSAYRRSAGGAAGCRRTAWAPPSAACHASAGPRG